MNNAATTWICTGQQQRQGKRRVLERRQDPGGEEINHAATKIRQAPATARRKIVQRKKIMSPDQRETKLSSGPAEVKIPKKNPAQD
jgi:hypothetical protein